MVAFDVLGMAPKASIYDVRISGAKGSREPMSAVISEATAAFQWCIEHFRRDGTPHIITCSWGMMQSAWEPVYARDPTHFFTSRVQEALDEGIIVLFAAGNCGGSGCCHKQCGKEHGPGRSIWGANGHPRVITVGAATREEKLAGYSSEGPAALDKKKPDFCGITHFEGYTRCDSGTSASTPITAGVVALLKQKKSGLTQTEAKKVLQETAKPVHFKGWNPHFGHGIIQPGKAFDLL
jgi:subtilase family serine protease